MLIFEITEMKTTDYMDTKELGDIIKQYGGSDEVASKVLAALRVFQTKSMEIFYKIEAEQGYSVNGKPLEKSLIRRLVPKSVPDDVVGIWIAKNISPKGTKLKPNWSWREDPKAFTQHPDMIKLRKAVQNHMQKALDDGDVPITIQHFDQDNEMAPLFRLNIETNESEENFGEDVVGMNPQAVKPYFSPEEADRANDEWINQAQVDQEDGVIVKGTDGKQYRIMTSYNNEHFEDGEVYLDGLTDPDYIDTEGYPDAAELLYYHSATGHYPEDPDEINENENEPLPPEVEEFVNKITPTDTGKDIVGEYVVHYEGFTDECNDGHDDESIEQVYAEVYQDFDDRQGQTAMIRGVANDELGCGNNPVLYSVYKNVNENFADGKKKGKSRPGRVKKAGASCKGSVTSLRAKAKKYSGERGKMYHWCANMKGGKKKK